VFLNFHYHLLTVEEDQVQGVQHTQHMDPVGGHDPEAFAGLSPSRCGAQEAYEPAEVAVSHLGARRDKNLPGPIIDADIPPAVKDQPTHGSPLPVSISQPEALPRYLLFSPPNDDEQNDNGQNPSNDPNGGGIHQ
jgi:hypothetical protein